jgi:hypothetical protein
MLRQLAWINWRLLKDRLGSMLLKNPVTEPPLSTPMAFFSGEAPIFGGAQRDF